MPELVIVSGPIGAGKSTFSQALAALLRMRGRAAAVIDLDLVYDMLDHRPKSDPAVWRRARQAAAALTDHFFASAIDIVIVEGTISTARERSDFFDVLTTPVVPRLVGLRVSYAAALSRVQADRNRKPGGRSLDAAFLAELTPSSIQPERIACWILNEHRPKRSPSSSPIALLGSLGTFTTAVEEPVQYVAIAAGAVLGANLRFVVSGWAADRWGAEFPYGTLIVNVSGAFVIGLFLAFVGARVGINPLWRLFFATGFLGGYTTFSSFAWETLTLAEQGAWLRAVVYLIGTNAVGLLGVWLGAVLARIASV